VKQSVRVCTGLCGLCNFVGASGGVRRARGELHGALKDLGHLGLCRRLQKTKLYKSGCWGQKHIGFASLRLHMSAARSGIQERAMQSSERSETQGEKLLDFSSGRRVVT
jgi:hypothetical protein